MPQHDHRGTEEDMPTGQFNGEEIEFAPFMFDPEQQPVDNPTGQMDDVDMEFEPFMFNQGDISSLRSHTRTSGQLVTGSIGSRSTLVELPAEPPEASPVAQTSEPVAVTSQEASASQAVGAPAGQPAPEVPTSPSPFEGQELPAPSYMMASDSEAAGAPPADLPDAAVPQADVAPLPDWFVGSDAPTSLISQESVHNTEPVASAEPASQPGSRSAQGAHAQTSSAPVPATAPAPAPVPATPSSGFGSVPGRTRGNTGPLATTMPNASWSDNSLSSIEDFSSVLIAMRAGKRLRQSGPVSETMLAQGASSTATNTGFAPGTSAFPTAPTLEIAHDATEVMPAQPGMPDWAAQAVVGLTGLSTPPSGQAIQGAPEETADWPGSTPWEPTLPGQGGPVWTGAAQPQTAMPEGPLLPSWNADTPASPAEAPSWTAAQPPVQAPAPMPEPVRPAPTSGATDATKVDFSALKSASLDASRGNLDPDVSSLLQNMDRSISGGTVSGDEIEFEGFMFNQGVPAPLPVLPSLDSTAMSALSQDIGPAFDPTLYENATLGSDDSDSSFDYADFDASAIVGSAAGDAQNPLPFWLQDPSMRNAGGSGDTGAAVVSDVMPASLGAMPDSGPSGQSQSSDLDFNNLPPIDPFDFSMIEGGVEDEPFGFNTEELSGLMTGGRDPMVVTANLEALADLMGGHGSLPVDTKSHRQAAKGNSDSPMPPATRPAPAPQPAPKPVQNAAPPPVDATPAEAPRRRSNEEELQAAMQGAPKPGSGVQTAPSERVEAEQNDSATKGWMATVTSGLPNLPAGSLGVPSTVNLGTGVTTPATEATSEPAMPAVADSADAEISMDDMDIAPFDFTQIDMDSDAESPTNYLQSSGMLKGPSTSKLDLATGVNIESAEAAEAYEPWNEADGDTSLFTPSPASQEDSELSTGQLREETVDAKPEHKPSNSHQEAPKGTASPTAEAAPAQNKVTTAELHGLVGRISTGQLTDRLSAATATSNRGGGVPETTVQGQGLPTSAQASAAPPSADFVPAPDMVDEASTPDQQEAPVFKARVASGAWSSFPASPTAQPEEGNREASSEPVDVAPPAPPLRKAAGTKVLEQKEPEPEQEPETEEAASQEEAPDSSIDFEEPYEPRMPAYGDITVSGPLPSLDGFEDMTAWIERYPQDMGAHLALASAYTQAGDIDTALRVYRRMLRRSSVTTNVLSMIQDELEDLEDQAHQFPRYYQVRGDLLVRQGHRRAAIDEYNKLG